MSPGWQSRAAQMASRVEKRTALALLFFRIYRLARVMSTFSDSWLRDIFRLAIITSKFTTIAIDSPQIVRSFSALISAAWRNRADMTRHRSPAMANRGTSRAV